MIKHSIKKTIILLSLIIACASSQMFATEFAILPTSGSSEGEIQGIIQGVAQGGEVIDNYKAAAADLDKENDIGTQFATGIISRNTIPKYAAQLIKFISQMGLLIGGVMVIYAGYQYITTVFGGNASAGNTAIKNAVAGILVIIFSYAILRFVISAFL